MHLAPSRRLVRLVCLVLLAWTAVDLSASGLCALDREDALLACADPTTVGNSESNPNAARPVAHVDDCFCCSHCVNITLLTPVVTLTSDATRRLPTTVTRPRNIARTLYHPPKTSR
jgi:hypothetical protein